MATNQNRRSAIRNMLAGTAAIGASGMLSSFTEVSTNKMATDKLKGNINHSVCRWCYADISLDQLCAAAKDMGIKSIDLVGPKRMAHPAKIWLVLRHVQRRRNKPD